MNSIISVQIKKTGGEEVRKKSKKNFFLFFHVLRFFLQISSKSRGIWFKLSKIFLRIILVYKKSVINVYTYVYMCVFVSVSQRCMLKLLVFLLLPCYCNINSGFVKIVVSLKCNIFLLLIETVKLYSHVWHYNFVLSCTILTENTDHENSQLLVRNGSRELAPENWLTHVKIFY